MHPVELKEPSFFHTVYTGQLRARANLQLTVITDGALSLAVDHALNSVCDRNRPT